MTEMLVTLQGNVQGTVVAMPIANQTAPAQNDDGGFGSVPYLLLQVNSQSKGSTARNCDSTPRCLKCHDTLAGFVGRWVL